MSDQAEPLVATSSQTVGPFFHFGLTTDALLGTMVGPDTPGQRITVRVCVIDGGGVPLPDAMVELWQADSRGHYVETADHANPDPGQAFRGWGRLPTDANGICEFHTVRPGEHVGDDGQAEAAHVNICLFARGMLRHVFTRFYFAGDAAIATDPVLALVPETRRGTLLAHEIDGLWKFDIHLQGASETVFFDL